MKVHLPYNLLKSCFIFSSVEASKFAVASSTSKILEPPTKTLRTPLIIHMICFSPIEILFPPSIILLYILNFY